MCGGTTKARLVLPDLGVLLGHCQDTLHPRARQVSVAKNGVEQFLSILLFCIRGKNLP